MSNIVSRIIAIESGEAGPLETIETFGELVRTGAAHGLQGSWQRAIVEAMEGGLLTPDGDVTEEAYATFGDIEVATGHPSYADFVGEDDIENEED